MPGLPNRKHNLHDPLELDLDMLRERHLFPQDCLQLGVERGGVEGAGVVATMAFVGIPVRQFLDAPAAQARLTAVGGLGRHRPRRAGLIERIWPQVADRPGRLNSSPEERAELEAYWREDFEEAQAPDFRCASDPTNISKERLLAAALSRSRHPARACPQVE